ncbi:MAG: TetR/AcrR family transcriptional regulator [Pseudomonadota bacterium]
MKTRDRILSACLDLFNSEGEANVTALDVANVLEISPGNLYYHFKGKDALIKALFDSFEEEMAIILQGAKNRLASLEDHWVFLYILLEEIYDFRFFYQSLGILTARYPSLANRFEALNQRLRKTLDTSLQSFGQDAQFVSQPRIKSVLLDQLVSTLTFWLEEDVMYGRDTPPAELIHQTVLRALLTVAPYLAGDQQDAQQQILAKYDQVLS